MKTNITRLAALIAASLAPRADGSNEPPQPPELLLEDSPLLPGVLNESVSDRLAAHRSHSSHRSHRSHRSSSGGSYPRTPTPSAPRQTQPAPSPPARTAPRQGERHIERTPPRPQTADPLGQEPRSAASYPPAKAKDLPAALADKELRKNIIMRMQLTLQFEGYYDGAVDGIMGPKTRAAVLAYKKAKGIPGSEVLDASTLNSLGILGY